MEKADSTRFEGLLTGKTVVLGITASISIYRVPDIIRDLRREGAMVVVGMSREAQELISPEVMHWASENDVVTRITGDIEHISKFIGRPQDTILLVCPASYNFIGKASSGISDDVPSLFFSFALGNGNKVVISPVMHEGMMVNPINSENLAKLENLGVSVIPPRMEESKAKISESDTIIDYVSRAFFGTELKGRNLLVIGGRGEEKIDPVRSITNSGSGLTAVWLLRNAFRLGAASISFVGNSRYQVPQYVRHYNASEMSEFEENAVKAIKDDKMDAVVNVASLSDFTIGKPYSDKLDSSLKVDLHLEPRRKLNAIIRERFKGHLTVFKLSIRATAPELRLWFNETQPDLIIFNSFESGRDPFDDVANHYLAVTPDGERDLGNIAKSKLTLELLRMIASAIKRKK